MRSRQLYAIRACRLAAVAAGLLACACIYDHPDPNCVVATGGGLRVEFDWSADPTAKPEGMSVLFYPEDGGSYSRFEIAPGGGGARLAAGRYHIVTYNNDTGSILFENQDDYRKALVTTRPARLTDGLSMDYPYSQPPRSREEESQPIVSQPDVIWGGADPLFERVGGNQTLTLEPRPLVARYSVVVEDVVNIESASQVSMALSGLTAGRVLCDGEMIPVDVTVPGSMRRTALDELGGWMLGFDRINDRGRCLLSIYAVLRDGTRRVYERDVTETVRNAPDQTDVEIRISGIEFPEIETSEGTGMEVGVDDWEVVEIELST